MDVNKELQEEWQNYLYEIKNSSKSNVGKQHKHFKRVISDFLQDIRIQNLNQMDKGEEPVLTFLQMERINLVEFTGLRGFNSNLFPIAV